MCHGWSASQMTKVLLKPQPRSLNLTGKRAHFSFDKNSSNYFFVTTNEEIRTHDFQQTEMLKMASVFHEPVLKGEKTPALEKLHNLLIKQKFED